MFLTTQIIILTFQTVLPKLHPEMRLAGKIIDIN